MEEQLRLIGVRVSTTTDEAEALVLEVVVKSRGTHDVIAWLAERVVAWDP